MPKKRQFPQATKLRAARYAPRLVAFVKANDPVAVAMVLKEAKANCSPIEIQTQRTVVSALAGLQRYTDAPEEQAKAKNIVTMLLNASTHVTVYAVKEIVQTEHMTIDEKKACFELLKQKKIRFDGRDHKIPAMNYMVPTQDVALLDATSDLLLDMGAKWPLASAFDHYIRTGEDTFYRALLGKIQKNPVPLDTYKNALYSVVNTQFYSNPVPVNIVCYDYARLRKRLKPATHPQSESTQSQQRNIDALADLTMAMAPGTEPDYCTLMAVSAEFMIDFGWQPKRKPEKPKEGVPAPAWNPAEQSFSFSKAESPAILQQVNTFRDGKNKEGKAQNFRNYHTMIRHVRDFSHTFSNRVLMPFFFKEMKARNLQGFYNQNDVQKIFYHYGAAILFGQTETQKMLAMHKVLELVARTDLQEDDIISEVSTPENALWLPLSEDWKSSNGYYVVNLFNKEMQLAEHDALGHCIHNQAANCMYHDLRTFGVRVDPETPLYTAGLTIRPQKKSITEYSQPLGKGNAVAPAPALAAWSEYKRAITEGKIAVDWPALAEESRANKLQRSDASMKLVVGYDFFKEGTVERVFDAYHRALKPARCSRLDFATPEDFIRSYKIDLLIGTLVKECETVKAKQLQHE